MATATFDKLVYLETLKASGIAEDQAKAHAHALDEGYGTASRPGETSSASALK